jgi:dipeptidase
MGGDMMTALGRAVVDGHTLFGHNAAGGSGVPLHLARAPGGSHAPDERVRATHIELPQARHTHATLGGQPAGAWGFCHGVNEHGVAAGCTRLRTRLRLDAPGLTGPDLVRLALERGQTAHQAVDALTALVARHGQGAFRGCADEQAYDAAVLIADGREAYLIETSGSAWVCQEVREVRAAGDVCTVRQDWDAIAPGLAGRVIDSGWWPEDGSKLDFAGALAAADEAGPALRRWGQATRLLEEQSGHIDASFLRRVLADHYEGSDHEIDPHAPGAGPQSLCRHAAPARPSVTAASLVAVLGGALPLAWWAYGPPCAALYFPLLPAGDLPPALAGDGDPEARLARLTAVVDPALRARARAALEGLQALQDAETAEFLADAAALKDRAPEEVRRQATLFMQHAWEEFAEVVDGLLGTCQLSAAGCELPSF